MTEPLGRVPIKRKLILSAGADFTQKISVESSDPDIPLGTNAEIVVYDLGGAEVATWPATTIGTDVIEWLVHSEDTDTIDDGSTYRLYVHYTVGEGTTIDHLWLYGDVQRKQ